MTKPTQSTTSVGHRVDLLDWNAIAWSLDERGYAKTPPLLTVDECDDLIALYSDDRNFRSRIDMSKYRFGIGEYKYFENPLPQSVRMLRESAYHHLWAVANRWMALLGKDERYPHDLKSFLEVCHAQSQARPTPLLLRYEAGGYNCMHQDVYGAMAFPLQMTCVLSRRGVDYTGGEFLLVESRPRAQSRGSAITLEQGEAIIFPNSFRPIQGARGYYRAGMRHGVSELQTGIRFSLGVIFHDAK